MRHLLRIATLVAATTLAARAGAATIAAHAPPGSCFLVGGFSKCADPTSRLSASEFFGTFLTRAEAAGSGPFEVLESDVFVSAIRSLDGKDLDTKLNGKDLDTKGSATKASLKTCRERAESDAGGALCSEALPADMVTPEPAGMLLVAMGLFGMAALELWRRSRGL